MKDRYVFIWYQFLLLTPLLNLLCCFGSDREIGMRWGSMKMGDAQMRAAFKEYDRLNLSLILSAYLACLFLAGFLLCDCICVGVFWACSPSSEAWGKG